MGRRILQSDRHATLLVDVLRTCVAKRRVVLHDFVIMPDHIHLLLSVVEISVERAVQFIKGAFSYRMKSEMGYSGEIWQRGFSEMRVRDSRSFGSHRRYIALNPLRAGLVGPGEMFPWCFEALKMKKLQRLKPHSEGDGNGTTEVVP